MNDLPFRNLGFFAVVKKRMFPWSGVMAMGWARAGWCLCALLLTQAADSDPVGPTRTQVQVYDSEVPTEILTVPGVPTDLQLAPHEKITGLALGDTLQWRVEELPGHLFLKPLRPDLFTAGTLVTNLRVYSLVLRSTTPQGPWVMRVRWILDEEKSLSSPSGKTIHPFSLIPRRVHTHYTIKGDAEFRPLEVFDDGRFTWIDMGHPQVLPAVFIVDAEGSRLVNYLLHPPYFVVQRLMPRFLLKLGGTEVEVINPDYGKSSEAQGEVPEQKP
jgi:type IV secretion system protein VirB9